MTIFAVIRAFTYLTRDAYLAAAGLLRGPGLPGYDDDADVLAEREARVDVTEPELSCYMSHPNPGYPCASNLEDDCGLSGTERCECGGTRVMFHTVDCPVQLAEAHMSLTAGYEKLAADPDRSAYRRRPSGAGSYTDRSLDRITALLEDIRNLLQHDGGRGDGKDVGERAESSSGAGALVSPTSPPRPRPAGSGPRCTSMFIDTYQCRKRQGHTGDHATHQNGYGEEYTWPNPHAPVASASPQTPADATGSDPTLANDPARTQCRNRHPEFLRYEYSCTKPAGHAGKHGYAGMFWQDDTK